MACGARHEKRLIRERARLAVEGLSHAERAAASALICRGVANLDAWRRARVVMLYCAIPGEPEAAALETLAFEAGKRLALPRMEWEAGRMEAVEVAGPGYATEVRRHGVVEPAPGAGAGLELKPVDLVVVPGVAFDRAGGRVGRGGGFYDRFLEAWRLARRAGALGAGAAVGVCFRAQLVERVPLEPHDAVMDAVVWEGGEAPPG